MGLTESTSTLVSCRHEKILVTAIAAFYFWGKEYKTKPRICALSRGWRIKYSQSCLGTENLHSEVAVCIINRRFQFYMRRDVKAPSRQRRATGSTLPHETKLALSVQGNVSFLSSTDCFEKHLFLPSRGHWSWLTQLFSQNISDAWPRWKKTVIRKHAMWAVRDWGSGQVNILVSKWWCINKEQFSNPAVVNVAAVARSLSRSEVGETLWF